MKLSSRITAALIAASLVMPAYAAQPVDRVLAVVNEDVITTSDLAKQTKQILASMRTNKTQPPPADVLERQLLEKMITEKTIFQYARENSIRVDDLALDATLARIAQGNKLTVEQMRAEVEHDGQTWEAFRTEIRQEMLAQRVREKEVDARINITDAEIDNFLAGPDAAAQRQDEVLISHIFVRVPDQATSAQIADRQKRAEEALGKIKLGGDFSQMAATYSDAQDALSGGSLGWRPAANVPTPFVEPLRTMSKGQASDIIRSPAGFHIFKLMDERKKDAPTMVEKTHARHILTRVNDTNSEADARTKIDRAQDRLKSGAKFADIAKQLSEDASGARGGDLGWLSPGDTVPEFEKAMNALKPGETSGVIRSPFGFHIIEVVERKSEDVSKERDRSTARQTLRERRIDEAWQDWVRENRDRAFVEIKSE